MQKQDKYAYWQMLSDYDLETIHTLIAGERWVYVVFLCQQALERQLKGMYVYFTNKEAPKTHNVSFLFTKITAAKSFQEEADQERFKEREAECEDLLVDAMFYYMSDYPFSYKNIMSRFVQKDVALELHQRTLDMIAWLRSFLPAADYAALEAAEGEEE